MYSVWRDRPIQTGATTIWRNAVRVLKRVLRVLKRGAHVRNADDKQTWHHKERESKNIVLQRFCPSHATRALSDSSIVAPTFVKSCWSKIIEMSRIRPSVCAWSGTVTALKPGVRIRNGRRRELRLRFCSNLCIIRSRSCAPGFAGGPTYRNGQDFSLLAFRSSL